MTPDHALDDVETETRTLADRLGREEGLEHPRLILLRDARAIVGHADNDVVASAAC
jgi:hypothetical protein